MKYKELKQKHKQTFTYTWRLIKVYPDGSLKFASCNSCYATVPVRGEGAGCQCQLCSSLPESMGRLIRMANYMLLILSAFDDAEVIDESPPL